MIFYHFSLFCPLLPPYKGSVWWLMLRNKNFQKYFFCFEHFPKLLEIIEDNQWSLRNEVRNESVSKKKYNSHSNFWIYWLNPCWDAGCSGNAGGLCGNMTTHLKLLGLAFCCILQCSELGEARVDLDWTRSRSQTAEKDRLRGMVEYCLFLSFHSILYLYLYFINISYLYFHRKYKLNIDTWLTVASKC